jgi:ankyrin repeat protein
VRNRRSKCVVEFTRHLIFIVCIEQLSLSCTRKLVNVLSANQLSFVKLSQFAFENARLDLAKYLLEKESDSVVAQHYSFGLYYATKHDWLDVARHLLDRGVRVNSFWNSKTALRCACKYGRLNIAQLLLKRGAKPYRHRSNKNDLLPIQFCCRNGNEALLKLLLDSSSSFYVSNSAAAVIFRNFPLAHCVRQWPLELR